MVKVMAALAALGLMSCAYIGQPDATWEQQFYEADQVATGVMDSVVITLASFRESGSTVPREVKEALRGQALVLKTTRTELLRWVRICGMESMECPPEVRIQLGIDNFIAATNVTKSILLEVASYE